MGAVQKRLMKFLVPFDDSGKKESKEMGFEPMRAEHTALAGRPINRFGTPPFVEFRGESLDFILFV